MAKSEPKKKCFLIMPITTPANLVEQYKGDKDHFGHVLELLFIPALEEAGFEPIPPKAEGSNVIHADIIKQLSDCELVLCDMSIFNPNVFYEFGIRTALDKPVALVVDDKTTPIPFDTGIINFYKYDSSLAAWTLEKQKKELTKHVQEACKKSKGRNALWKYFGVAQTGMFKPGDAELGEKIDLVIGKLSAFEIQRNESDKLIDTSDYTFRKVKGTYVDTPTLTPIEMKVLNMIFEGKSIQEIAGLLNRTTKIVEIHRSTIMIKLEVDNPHDLIKRAIELELVDF